MIEQNPDLGVLEAELAGGLSDSVVYKTSGAFGLRVIKLQKDKREFEFFNQLVPQYLSDVAWLPKRFRCGLFAEFNWLEFEYLPLPWPRQRFNFDAAGLKVLHQLHSVAVDSQVVDWNNLFWTREQLEYAFDCLPETSRDLLELVYSAYLERVDDNICLCSGDANAPNWMIRDNGEIVLIDWQQVTLANKALDLAGWIATMLGFDQISEVARVYLGSSDQNEIEDLARDIAIFFTRRCMVNLWLAKRSTCPEKWAASNDYLVSVFPEWLVAVVREAKIN